MSMYTIQTSRMARYEVSSRNIKNGNHARPSTGQVLGRPAGLVTGADGALYISDDNKGFVYRVSYQGK